MTKVYNKLVRDNIPDIIKRNDENVSLKSVGDDVRRKETTVEVKYRILEDDELKKAAIAKLIEEAQELGNAHDYHDIIEELADIYEVTLLLLNLYGAGWGIMPDEFLKTVFNTARIKAATKGAFDRGIFLEEVSIVPKHGDEDEA